MNKRFTIQFLFMLMCSVGISKAQQPLSVDSAALEKVLNTYTSGITMHRVKLDSLRLSHDTLAVYASPNYAYVSFTASRCKTMYEDLKRKVPQTMQPFQLAVYAGDQQIEELIPLFFQSKDNMAQAFTYAPYSSLVKNLLRPYTISTGL